MPCWLQKLHGVQIEGLSHMVAVASPTPVGRVMRRPRWILAYRGRVMHRPQIRYRIVFVSSPRPCDAQTRGPQAEMSPYQGRVMRRPWLFRMLPYWGRVMRRL